MSSLTRLMTSLVTGLLLGAATTFLLCVAVAVAAYATGSPVNLPGIFRAWFTEENGLPALNFEPQGLGFLLLSLAIGAAYTVVALGAGRRLRHG